MNPSSLVVGAIYLLTGGRIMRYQGPYSRTKVPHLERSPRPGLAFRSPIEGVKEPATGYSAGIDEVLRRISIGDLPMLRTRVEQAQARNLTTLVEETLCVISELCGHA